jgi:hypothetical protein
MPIVPRGLRLNNGGNIRHSEAVWMGQAAAQPDPSFVSFTAPVFGIRALARVLLAYQRRHGLRTLQEIVARWAPPSDSNDTDAYVRDVAGELAIGPDQEINLENAAVLGKLVSAIVRHENGQMPFAPSLIADGVRMALA